ncbi:MAG: molybdopterin-binding protein, partial [Candidatus Eisenbacteria bacterium]
PRDVTPEATLSVAHRVVPGIHEWIRASTGASLPAAYLSRGVAVLRDSTLIVNLPGSPRAVTEYLAHLGQILPHALAQIRSAPGSPEADQHPTRPRTEPSEQ